jgi:hypothetical protein
MRKSNHYDAKHSGMAAMLLTTAATIFGGILVSAHSQTFTSHV